LEDEAVAHDPNVGAALENLAQAAEEVGSVAREILYALGKGEVEAAAEIGDLRAALLIARLGGIQSLLERGDLRAQRRQLLVEERHLGGGLAGDFLFGLEVGLESGYLCVLAIVTGA